VTIREAMRVSRDTSQAITRPGGWSIRWDERPGYTLTAEDLIAEDWQVVPRVERQEAGA